MSTNSNPDPSRDSNPSPSVRSIQKGTALRLPKIKSAGTRPIHVKDFVEPPSDDLWLRFKQNLHTFFGTLLSLLVHLAILVSLALFVYSQKKQEQPGLAAEIVSPPEQQELVEAPEPEVTIDIAPLENESPVEDIAVDQSTQSEMVTPEIDHSDTDSTQPDDMAAPLVESVPESVDGVLPTGGGLEGRQVESRGALAAKYGGTPESELAVENGLKWLANHQHPDGSWRLDFRQGPCQGRCRNPGTREVTTAATGLSLMAFLGAGYTHRDGPYQQQVQDGLDYLKSKLKKSVFGGNLTEGTMYAQAIAVIALSEAYNMTKDEALKDTIESALQYIVTAQHQQGGWRYIPGEPGDITVTGWQIMALKSCRMAGFEVPDQTIKKAKKFLYSVGSESDGLFGYTDQNPDKTSTAIGLAVQLFLGWSTDNRAMFKGTRFIKKEGPSHNNIYYNYYATLTLFHSRHSGWDGWNKEMRDYLIETQSTAGHESGSWFFKENYGTVGGRLYTTAMAIMILEVYYRYLPLFDRDLIKTSRVQRGRR